MTDKNKKHIFCKLWEQNRTMYKIMIGVLVICFIVLLTQYKVEKTIPDDFTTCGITFAGCPEGYKQQLLGWDCVRCYKPQKVKDIDFNMSKICQDYLREEEQKDIPLNLTLLQQEDYPDSYYEAFGWYKVNCSICGGGKDKEVWSDGCNHHICFRETCTSTLVYCFDSSNRINFPEPPKTELPKDYNTGG